MKYIKIAGIILFSLTLVFTATITLCYTTSASYLYCLARESSWISAKDEKQLEHRLFAFFSKSEIEPKESDWGSNYLLKENESMVRYLIFGKEPFDVIFNERREVVESFTTYE